MNTSLFEKSQDLQFRIETIRAQIGELDKQTALALSDIAVAENDTLHAQKRINEIEEEILQSESLGTTVLDVINEKVL
jgi:hypothetical protein